MPHKDVATRLVAFVIFLAGIVSVSYFFERHQTTFILPSYFLSFGIYWYLFQQKVLFSTKELIVLGVIARVLLLPALPVLSDDVYRFIWDGRLLNEGISPFAQIPSYYMEHAQLQITGITEALFYQLNSPNYFTVYPPIAQLIFWISVVPFPENELGSIIIIRLLSIFAEIGVIYFGLKLLKHFKLPSRNILIYFLNPLVILELTGSLHFEGFMIFFLIAGIYFYQKKQFPLAGMFWALAIGVKLIPLIFLPLILFKSSIKQNLQLFIALGITVTLIFIPIFDKSLINGLSESLSLYFQHFEFNASVYYIVREIGYWVKGYNIIATSGKALAMLSFLSIITISIISRKNKWALTETFVLILLSYFMFTNILHPWYVVSILALSIFTQLRFTATWSALIFLTYAGYSVNGFSENLWLVVTEYVIMLSIFFYEIKMKQPFKSMSL